MNPEHGTHKWHNNKTLCLVLLEVLQNGANTPPFCFLYTHTRQQQVEGERKGREEKKEGQDRPASGLSKGQKSMPYVSAANKNAAGLSHIAPNGQKNQPIPAFLSGSFPVDLSVLCLCRYNRTSDGAMATPLEDLPLKVRRVKIVGNNRTRPYVVEDQLQVGWLRVHVLLGGRSLHSTRQDQDQRHTEERVPSLRPLLT